jgi:hypothetical protein
MSFEAISTLINGIQQADASQRAADVLGQGAAEIGKNAKTYQEQMAPWYNTGSKAITDLGNQNAAGAFNVEPYGATPFNYQQSPGYQWQTQQGNNALQGSAAARGGLFSGTTMKALQKYGIGAAAQDYHQAYQDYMANSMNVYNTKAQQAEQAFNRGNILSQAGREVPGNYAQMQNQSAMGAANAKASGIMGVSNAWGGVLAGFDPLGEVLGGQRQAATPQMQQPTQGLQGGTYQDLSAGVLGNAAAQGALSSGGYAGSYTGGLGIDAAAGVGGGAILGGTAGAGSGVALTDLAPLLVG